MTNGYQVTVDTCSSEIVFGYVYTVASYFQEWSDGSDISDFFYVVIVDCLTSTDTITLTPNAPGPSAVTLVAGV